MNRTLEKIIRCFNEESSKFHKGLSINQLREEVVPRIEATLTSTTGIRFLP
ncbi:hypothetical protein Sjap_009974 [Stephania japonica]|uniref:Uncharacterized protein n=1 Tax=Stephania japonica TaxID=461633 RepID=A0AAP0P383_9MAGN